MVFIIESLSPSSFSLFAFFPILTVCLSSYLAHYCLLPLPYSLSLTAYIFHLLALRLSACRLILLIANYLYPTASPYLHTFSTCLPCACLPVVLSCCLPATSAACHCLQTFPTCLLSACLPAVLYELYLLNACHFCILSLPAYISHLLALRLSACLPSFLSKHGGTFYIRQSC
jgi:hypothetical protein